MTFLIPTMMRTKLPWYLNPFYPVFALGIASILMRGVMHYPDGRWGPRQAVLAMAIVAALGIAEGKLLWYPLHYPRCERFRPGAAAAGAGPLKKPRGVSTPLGSRGTFVASGVIGVERALAGRGETFWRESRPGDCLISVRRVSDPGLMLIRSSRHHTLYCRAE